jgi:RNA-directed DNA polymerase
MRLVLSEDGVERDTTTGTPQGRILSPLLANIALTVLDDHFAEAWTAMGDFNARHRRRRKGLATYRLVRYADDFVVMVNGTCDHAAELRDEVAAVLAPIGLRLSEAKTRIVHIDEGFDFLGSHPAALQARLRQVVRLHLPLEEGARLDQGQGADDDPRGDEPTARSPVLPARAGVAGLGQLLPTRRVQVDLRLLRARVHLAQGDLLAPPQTPHANWKWLRRRYLPGWWPTDGEVTLLDVGKVAVTRYHYRGNTIPTPWTWALAETVA